MKIQLDRLQCDNSTLVKTIEILSEQLCIQRESNIIVNSQMKDTKIKRKIYLKRKKITRITLTGIMLARIKRKGKRSQRRENYQHQSLPKLTDL